MAAPTRAGISQGNIGDATISAASVVDRNDPGLLTSSVIEFTTPTTYSINGAGSFAYVDGDPIVINGSSVTLSGAPSVGDQFTGILLGLAKYRPFIGVGRVDADATVTIGTGSNIVASGDVLITARTDSVTAQTVKGAGFAFGYARAESDATLTVESGATISSKAIANILRESTARWVPLVRGRLDDFRGGE